MTIHLQVGSVLIREGLLLPRPLKVDSESYSKHWRIVTGTDGFGLAEDIRAVGWHYIFTAAQVKAAHFGWRSGNSADRAIARVLLELRKQSLNCVEITEIARRQFLGVPYTAISAHGRHIQESQSLPAEPERRRAQAEIDWACD